MGRCGLLGGLEASDVPNLPGRSTCGGCACGAGVEAKWPDASEGTNLTYPPSAVVGQVLARGACGSAVEGRFQGVMVRPGRLGEIEAR